MLALADLKADSAKGIALAEALLAVLRTHAPRVFERDDELRLHSERLSAIVAKPALVALMQETFDQYWADAHQFAQYDHRSEADGARLRRALSLELRDDLDDQVLVEVEPKDFQKPVWKSLRWRAHSSVIGT